MPTLPGPISQTPLLQANWVVIKVGGGMGVDDWAAADAAPPRLAATSDPVISRALSGDRMTTSPGHGNGRRPCWPDAVTAPSRGAGQTPADPYHLSLDGHWRPSNREILTIPAIPGKVTPCPARCLQAPQSGTCARATVP